MAKNTPEGEPAHVEDQARQQTGQQQVRVRVSEQDMTTTYANAVRSNGTAEEVFLDFGVNMVNPATQQGQSPEILFNITNRVVLNYYSAKRLALSLGQLIRRHEEQFGELELDVSKRQKSSK